MISKLKRIKLGALIEAVDIRNNDSAHGPDFVRGISTSKLFIPTKADLHGVDLSGYKIVPTNHFAYVADTSRRGEKIAIAFADFEECIISSIYTVFKIKDESIIAPRYLMMFFNRSEFDRYARFHSWGSARETFDWDEMCNVEIDLPPLEVQEKYSNIYRSIKKRKDLIDKFPNLCSILIKGSLVDKNNYEE